MKNKQTIALSGRLQELTELKRDLDYTKSDKKQAFEMGIPYQTFRKYLSNRAECSIGNISKIADYYCVSTDYLLGRTDVKSTDTNIKQICEYTGLSEAAVNYLIKSKNENDKERRMMSLMIENPWMHSLVNSATAVEYYAEKDIDYLDAYLSYRYSCQEILTRLIDDILKEEGIFEEQKQ